MLITDVDSKRKAIIIKIATKMEKNLGGTFEETRKSDETFIMPDTIFFAKIRFALILNLSNRVFPD